MTERFIPLAVAACLELVLSARGQLTIPARSVTVGANDHVVLDLTVDDRMRPDIAAAAALVVRVDGRDAQHVLLTPGVGRTTYTAVLGPLERGKHEIAIAPAPWWPWPAAVNVTKTELKVVAAADGSAASTVLRYAPTLGLRADTIGTASDLPLVVYAEDLRRDGAGWIRYSVILSNEDGGTPAPALMARWGRTTDIELVYEVEVDGERVVQERFQGPDHEIRAVRGPHEGRHPYLLFATLNNMVVDRGRSVAAIRPLPSLVSLASRTRESVMDDHPWTYQVMARELAAENRIGTEIDDPREFFYVEANLMLENAAISAQAGSDATGWRDSNLGRADLAVNRNGWVRIALPAAATAPALRWNCQPRTGDAKAAARCDVEWTRAFRLGPDYLPGRNLIQPGRARLTAGFSDVIPFQSR